MTFRKNCLMFRDMQISCIIAVVLGLVSYTMILESWLCLFLTAILLIVFIANPKQMNEYITINEEGIFCCKTDKQLWAYKWDSIAELKQSSRFRQPSVEIILYPSAIESENCHLSERYFQLGHVAKEALKKYYQPKENAYNN